jgi:hypothetical protein
MDIGKKRLGRHRGRRVDYAKLHGADFASEGNDVLLD